MPWWIRRRRSRDRYVRPAPDRWPAGRARDGREGGVLLHDRRYPGERPDDSGKVGRRVAVGVQEVWALAPDEGEQVRHRRRTEGAPPQAQRFQPLAPQIIGPRILGPDADETGFEPGGIETGEPPGEQARHAVGPGTADPELVAQVKHADSFGHPHLRSPSGHGAMVPLIRIRVYLPGGRIRASTGTWDCGGRNSVFGPLGAVTPVTSPGRAAAP